MKLFSYALLLSLSALFVFSACNQWPPQNDDLALQFIPEEASSVSVFRIPRLMEKADFESLKKLPIYQKMLEDAEAENPTLAKIAEDPAKSGVDYSQNFYAFSKMGAKHPGQTLSAVVMPLADASAFTRMMEAMRKTNIQQKEGYQIANRHGSYILWNQSVAMITMPYYGKTKPEVQLAAILNGKATSIAKNRDLQKAMSQDHDIATWFSSNAIANFEDAQMMLTGMGFNPDALKDNFIHGYVDFEPGKVIAHSDLLFRKALTKDLDLLFKSSVETDFSPYVPAENLGMVFSAAFDFKGLNQILAERPQSKGFVNYALKEYGLTTDDVAKALGGDLLVAVYVDEEKSSKASGLFITDIDKRSTFNKFLQLATDYQAIEKIEDDYYALRSEGKQFNRWINPHTLALSDHQPHMLLAHDMLFISADTDLLQTIKQGGFKKAARLDQEFHQQIQSNIFSALVNFKLLDDFSPEKNLPFEELNIKAERRSSDVYLELEDKSSNSLKTLLLMMNEAYEKDQMKLEGVQRAI